MHAGDGDGPGVGVEVTIAGKKGCICLLMYVHILTSQKGKYFERITYTPFLSLLVFFDF